MHQDHDFKEFKDYKWYNDVVFVPNGMTKEQLLKLHKQAYKEFYMRPKYIFKSVKRLRSLTAIKQTLAGFKTLVKIGW
jgi:hypothetical protein